LTTGALVSPTRARGRERQALTFRAVPARHLFKHGEDVVLILSIQNNSPDPVFVSSLRAKDFVDIRVIGPDGREAPWRGTGKIDSRSYSASDFTVLTSGKRVRAFRTISFKDGSGFLFERPGTYSVSARYSLGPPEYFAPLAGTARIPRGSFSSPPSALCVETCDGDSRK
jgi:hypothetical protein